MSENIIEIKNLTKCFDGGNPVLEDISVDIHKGDVISIIGPSGTGKSTFLRCINMLEQPTDGMILIDGVNIMDKRTPVNKIRQKMGMVFQSFNLFDHLSILENLTIGPVKLLGMSEEEAREKGIQLLRNVGLAAKADSMPSELSGGQKQRVAIARCLSMSPEIILFDEPTSALDPTMVSEVLAVIRQLAKTGITMLIVTHEMNFARNVSNRVFFMYGGKILEDGLPEQVFGHPQHNETRTFIQRIRSLHFVFSSEDDDFYAMTGAIDNFCVKYSIKTNRIAKLLHIVEEMLLITDRTSGVVIDIEYSETTEDVTVTVLQQSRSLSILNDPETDELALAILQGSSQTLQEEIIPEGVRFTFTV